MAATHTNQDRTQPEDEKPTKDSPIIVDEVVIEAAKWAAEETQSIARGPVALLHKQRFGSLEKLQEKYNSYRLLQIIRVHTADKLGNVEREGMLVALNTRKTCTVNGQAVRLGQEITIHAGRPMAVTPDGEFLYLEK